MSLASALPTLKNEIESALREIRDSGKKESANSDALISQMSKKFADAIQNYLESAQVITTHTISPGQISVSPTMVSPGLYAAPGSGSGNGSLKFSTNSALKSGIESAYKNARSRGALENANVSSIILSLANDIANEIHKFSVTAVVKTSITVSGGVPVSGYLSPASGVPVPFPSFSGPGSGNGVGQLS